MLTTQQLTTVKGVIDSTPALSSQPLNSDGAFIIAAALNEIAQPAWIVWRTNVATDEIMNNGFVWTAVDALTAGKARIWDWMTRLGGINPSKANIRQGLSDCFGANSAMATSIMPHLKTSATVVQKALSTGTGTTNSPATMDSNIGQDYAISYNEVELARQIGAV